MSTLLVAAPLVPSLGRGWQAGDRVRETERAAWWGAGQHGTVSLLLWLLGLDRAAPSRSDFLSMYCAPSGDLGPQGGQMGQRESWDFQLQ